MDVLMPEVRKIRRTNRTALDCGTSSPPGLEGRREVGTLWFAPQNRSKISTNYGSTMTLTPQQVAACRAQFPALSREFDGRPAVYFDGPAGTQVPRRVIGAISHYLSTMNANHGGLFPTGLESDRMLDDLLIAQRQILSGRTIRTKLRSGRI